MSEQESEETLLSLTVDPEHRKTFKVWIKALGVLAPDSRDTIYLNKTKDALRVSTMCPDRVSLVESEFDKNFFSIWHKKKIRFHFSHNDFSQVLKNMKDNKVELHLTFTTKRLTLKEHNLQLSIELFSEDIAEYPKPTLNNKVEGKMNSEQLSNSLGVAWNLKIDHIRFQNIEPNNLRLFAESHRFVFDDVIAFISSEIQEESSGMWSTAYLNELRDSSKLADELTIGYSSSKPLMLHWEFGVASFFTYFIAPRIETT